MSRPPTPQKARSAPCRNACPVDQNAKEYVALIAEGRFDDALEVIRRTNPFPSICGRICSHPCELECARASSGGAIAIRWLKRFVAERIDDARWADRAPHPEVTRRQSVAVIGGGPAGLTASMDLASLGYPVTLFEARPELGGMMRWAIPGFRLSRDLVSRETAVAGAMGVNVEVGVALGRDFVLDDLFARGFEAVLLAVGAWRQGGTGLAGERELTGIVDPLSFLETGLVDGSSELGKVVVLGATRQGFDTARSAARTTGVRVSLITHLGTRQLPVEAKEVEAARIDGVKLLTGLRPVELLGRRGKLHALVAQRVSGRGKPVKVDCSIVMPAMDRFVEPATLDACPQVATTVTGCVMADPISCETDRPNVFAAGDAATGPKTVIEAVAAGHTAAGRIHEKLSGQTWRATGRPTARGQGPGEWDLATGHTLHRARLHPLESPADALREAQRCLRCGTCLDCETCHPDCPTITAMSIRPGTSIPDPADPMIKIDAQAADTLESSLDFGGDLAVREIERFVASVDGERCLGCGLCVDVCPYDVARLGFARDGLAVASIDPDACRSCGCCVAACPVGAVDQPYFGHEPLESCVMEAGSDPLLRCQWSEGLPVEKTVPLPCAGRAGPRLLVRCFASGVRSVTLASCSDDCRFRSGHDAATSAVTRVRDLLGIMGLEPFRLAMKAERNAMVPPGPFIAKPPVVRKPTALPYGSVLADVESILAHPEVVPDVHVEDRGDVLVMTGCAPFADALTASELGQDHGCDAAIELIRRTGARPFRLSDQRCCGSRLQKMEPDEARTIRALLAESIERTGCRTMVTTCGLSARTLEKQIGGFGVGHVRVLHLASYLDEHPIVDASDHAVVMNVAVLDEPSDPSVRAAARRLLRNAGHRTVRFSPPRNRSVLDHLGRGRKGVIDMLRSARDAGADTIVTTSPGLALDLAYAVRPGTWDGFGVRVLDLATVLGGGRP